jgi:hypothetical protein
MLKVTHNFYKIFRNCDLVFLLLFLKLFKPFCLRIPVLFLIKKLRRTNNFGFFSKISDYTYIIYIQSLAVLSCNVMHRHDMKFHWWAQLCNLGAFAKLRKAAMSVVVCPFVIPSAWKNCGPTGPILMKFGIWGFFEYHDAVSPNSS